LLRSPGESLIVQIEDVTEDLLAYFCFMSLAPYIVYSIHITQSYFGGQAETYFRIISSLLLAFGMMGYLLFQLLKLFNRRTKLRVAYEAERATGQELNQLMQEGFHVYHDFPAEKFNIDHIVVGQSGVLAIETKGRSKKLTGKGKEDALVTYDGKTLKFPSHIETKPLSQAKDQAVWLSKWLTSATGEPIHVTPALTIPGWYIKRISPDGVPVMNPGEFRKFLKSKRDAALSEPQIKRIIHQLDQRCRDVEPKSYKS
jgi:hypothetical protein